MVGAVAQLGERVVRNDEVRGSNPLGSTMASDYVIDIARLFFLFLFVTIIFTHIMA